MSDAARWLERRLASAPPELVGVMLVAVEGRGEGESIADVLAASALELYAEVAVGSGGREDALPLLAADALLTHAFEAAAEVDPASIRSFAARWGGRGKLGEVVV